MVFPVLANKQTLVPQSYVENSILSILSKKNLSQTRSETSFNEL